MGFMKRAFKKLKNTAKRPFDPKSYKKDLRRAKEVAPAAIGAVVGYVATGFNPAGAAKGAAVGYALGKTKETADAAKSSAKAEKKSLKLQEGVINETKAEQAEQSRATEAENSRLQKEESDRLRNRKRGRRSLLSASETGVDNPGRRTLG